MSAIERARQDWLNKRQQRESCLAVTRQKMSLAYDSRFAQTFFATVVALNFLVSVIEKSLLADSSAQESERVFWILEIIFVSVFCLELLWNMGANLLTRFVLDPW